MNHTNFVVSAMVPNTGTGDLEYMASGPVNGMGKNNTVFVSIVMILIPLSIKA
jgi:hypothetical protein